MAELTFPEVCEWLRSQARTFERMADDIEATFGGLAKHANRRAPGDPPSVEKIKEAMGDRAVRISTLAAKLGVTQPWLERTLTTSNGFTRGSRGWWSVAQNGDNSGS